MIAESEIPWVYRELYLELRSTTIEGLNEEGGPLFDPAAYKNLIFCYEYTRIGDRAQELVKKIVGDDVNYNFKVYVGEHFGVFQELGESDNKLEIK